MKTFPESLLALSSLFSPFQQLTTRAQPPQPIPFNINVIATAIAPQNFTSPPSYPSPWMSPSAPGWQAAYAQAAAFVAQLTLLEKVNLTTGVGWQGEQCVGQTGSVPRLGLRSFCLQDGPVGVRYTDYNSVFPAGQTVAASFDRGLMFRRGEAMGKEQRDKGVTVMLGECAFAVGDI